MYHVIRGKRWRQRSVRLKNQWGWCVPDKAEILIAKGQTGDRFVETVLHEFLHCAFYDIDEDVVTEVAADLMRYLKRNKITLRDE